MRTRGTTQVLGRANGTQTRRLPTARGTSAVGLRPFFHSHSIVPGGLDVQSSTTLLTSGTEFVMRVEMRARTS